MNKIIKILSEWLKDFLRKIRSVLFSVFYFGNQRLCPICNKSSRKFRKYGKNYYNEVVCVHWYSLPRHRFVWLYMNHMTNLFDGNPKSFLHVAPEKCLMLKLKKRLKEGYVSADLYSRAMIKMDITNIQFIDESLDAVYCSHVLEHVQEDRKAMSEFYRILKKDGWAIFMVPITKGKTFEDPTITEPIERKRVFGQEDHVRCYGADFVDRLKKVGFNVKVDNAKDLFTENDIKYMGLPEGEDIFFCKKI